LLSNLMFICFCDDFEMYLSNFMIGWKKDEKVTLRKITMKILSKHLQHFFTQGFENFHLRFHLFNNSKDVTNKKKSLSLSLIWPIFPSCNW
jgi:hypothetical protein